MLLTLSKPAKSEFEYKTHEYSPSFSSSTSARYSPKFTGRSVSSQPASGPITMAADHRLPPPLPITLPDPARVQSSMGSHRHAPPSQSSMGQNLASLPPAPPQYQGAEDSMKNWLMAKSEEEKRKQEEERTKQETLKLDQRRVEHEMLRESMHGGIPPHLIPMIFAGIGGASIANMSAEWIREYSTQLQASQQQQQHQQQAQVQAQQQGLPPSQHTTPELRRMGQVQPGAVQPGVYGSVVYGGAPQTPQAAGIPPPGAVLPGQHHQGPPQHPGYSPPGRGGAPTSAPRPYPQSQSQLPRLNTTEMHIQPPATATSVNQSSQQQQQTSREPSSPLYFHHWVPPSTQQEKTPSGNQPATPSGKYKASSSSQHERPLASDPDYTSSPKKRKLGTQGVQDTAVAPQPPTWQPVTTMHSYASPSYSTSSTSTPRRGHGRNRSDASTRGTDVSRGAMSRRGTLQRAPEYPEGGGHHGEGPESQYSHPPPVAEGHYPNPYVQHQEQQAPAHPLQRNDGRGDGPQARAPSPRAAQGETRQSGPQPHSGGPNLGAVLGSPKRDVGGHQN